MSDATHTNHATAWTEIEYPEACRSPFLTAPVFVPKESNYFLCYEDGRREPSKLIYAVFKSADADEDAEWEDDPMFGNILVKILGDDDDEVIEPCAVTHLGVAPADFITKVREDDNVVVFRIAWRWGEVKIDKAEETHEGYAIRKDAFGEDGVACTLIPRRGKPFTIRIQIPYVGFSLIDPEGHKLHGDVEINHELEDKYSYTYVGDNANDRFSISFNNNKLCYLCVLRNESTMVVRDMRNGLDIIGEIPSQGSVKELMMSMQQAVVKSRNERWNITMGVVELHAAEDLVCQPHELARFAFQQFLATPDEDKTDLANQLMLLEQKLGFQWMWMNESDWSHEQMDGLLDMKDIENDPEKMMQQALVFNQFETFMKQLCAFSYISQQPIQGDMLQARNNKRKIARCAKWVLAHKKGELSLWDMEEEAREEVLHLFSTFHRQFTEALEG